MSARSGLDEIKVELPHLQHEWFILKGMESVGVQAIGLSVISDNGVDVSHEVEHVSFPVGLVNSDDREVDVGSGARHLKSCGKEWEPVTFEGQTFGAIAYKGKVPGFRRAKPYVIFNRSGVLEHVEGVRLWAQLDMLTEQRPTAFEFGGSILLPFASHHSSWYLLKPNERSPPELHVLVCVGIITHDPKRSHASASLQFDKPLKGPFLIRCERKPDSQRDLVPLDE